MKFTKLNVLNKGRRFVAFDGEKRRSYVTGFRKRKQERKERGRKINEEKAKKEKLAMRAKRRKAAKQILDEYENNMKIQTEIADLDYDSSSDEESQTSKVCYEPSVSNTVTKQFDGATVEISTLGLNSNHFLGSNLDFSECKLGISGVKHLVGNKLPAQSTKKTETEDQSFSHLVKDVMKKVQKQALKSVKASTSKRNRKTITNKSTKRKHLVTEL